MGIRLDKFVAAHHVPSVANGETAPSRYGQPEWLAFGPVGSDVTTYFQSMMDPACNLSGLRVRLHWISTAIVGAAVWGVSFAGYPPGSIITALPGTVFTAETVVVATTAAIASGSNYTLLDVPFVAAPIVANTFYRLRLRHLGSHVSRTLAVVPTVQAIHVENLT